MDAEPFPQYQRIALDIATRIASGDIREHEKLSGRSLLSAEYGVSPETARKALGLLADMKVVEAREKSGFTILSADNARRYVAAHRFRQSQQELYTELKLLAEQYGSVSRKMLDVCSTILDLRAHPIPTDRVLPNYEVRISPDSQRIGHNLGDLQFWQATEATIVAIRRGQNIILSPGPFAELYAGDIVVFVGMPECVSRVEQFLNGDPELS